MRFFLGLCLLLWAHFLFAQELRGKVTGVIDGDTYKILIGDKTVKVRLLGIDCPEHDQAYGYRAKQVALSYVKDKKVVVKVSGKDLYHRVLGTVFLENGTNVCQELVKAGYAWKYKYSHDKVLEDLESKARKAKLGLWADPKPVSPWEFKKSQKKDKRG